jgi:DNA primase
MTDTVQEIKDKLSIIEVVAPYVKLIKAGKYHRGLSPFGKEKTPSFYVNSERGTYYCFSTSQGGDHFEFIQKMEGVDFKGALKILAEKAGITITYAGGETRSKDKERLERLRQATVQAQHFFSEQLQEETSAYSYALSRGLSKETIRAWNLGLALDSWRGLLEHMGALGYSAAELSAAGLIKEADEKPGTWYDRFRNRLMFPISDGAGRTVAFTGRALGESDSAKYLNSPETDLFKKSEVLFGMDRAKDAIRTRGFAILVEGQFDLVLLHQAGFTNTIALSGTALSSKHIELIKRYAQNLMLCLDSDKAGLLASAKNAHAALLAGMKVKAITLPTGKDPADIVCEDPKTFTVLVQNAQSIVEFFLGILSREEPDELKLLRQVERIVLPLVSAVQSPLERNHFVELVARALSSTPEAVRESLPRVQMENTDNQEEDMSANYTSQTPQTPSSLESRRVRILATIANYPQSALANRLINEYARIIGAPLESTDSLDVLGNERALFEAGLAFGEDPDEASADDLIHMFERAFLEDEHKKATRMLRLAEAGKDTKEIEQAIKVSRDILSRLAKLP